MIKGNSNRKTVSFSNPINGGYQKFKKVFGITLVFIALYMGISITTLGINTIKGEINLAENKFINQIVPEDSASRSFKLSLPTNSHSEAVETVIEVPKNMLIISALLIGIFIFGIITRLAVAILGGGIGLMRDDVSFVFERLRTEIERNRIPTTPLESEQDKLSL